jgi:hypothetical protein
MASYRIFHSSLQGGPCNLHLVVLRGYVHILKATPFEIDCLCEFKLPEIEL